MYQSSGSTIKINDRVVAETDWNDPVSIGKACVELWRAREYKSRLEELAYRNEAYLVGDQWFEWDTTKNQMAPNPLKQPSWRSKLVVNEVYPGIEQRISMFSRQGRIWQPVSKDETLQARIRQKKQSKVLQAKWHSLNMPGVIRELLQWGFSSAIAFIEVKWDKNTGPMIEEYLEEWVFSAVANQPPEMHQEIIREQTNRFFQAFGIEATKAKFYSGPAGDVAVEVVPLYEEIWWPNAPKKRKDVKVWMRTFNKTVEEASEILGIPQKQLRATMESWQTNSTEYANHYYFGDDDTSPFDLDFVTLHHIVKAPCKAYPKGREAICVGFNGWVPNPPTDIQSASKRVATVPFVEKPVRGNMAGTCSVDQTASLQDDLNTTLSQACDYRNARSAPTLVEVGPGNANNRFSAVPGKTIHIKTKEDMPTFLESPDISIDHFRTAEIDSQKIRMMLGVAVDDFGGDESGASSGRAIVARREQNNARLQPVGEHLNEVIGEVGELVLAEIEARAITQRSESFPNENNAMETVEYDASQLRDDSFGGTNWKPTQVRVESFSNIPKSGTEMMNFVSMALDGGLFAMPPKQRNQILDMLQMSDARAMFDDTLNDEENARANIRKWEQGQPAPEPGPDDDDETHIKSIVDWKKTDDYRIIATMAPQVSMQVEDHLQKRKVNMARKLIEPEYAARAADMSLYMQYRAKALQAAAPDPMLTPEQNKMKAENVQQLVDLEFPAPLMAIGAMSAQQQGGGQQQQKPGEEKKQDGPGQPKKSAGPEQQGVKKEDQPQ